MAQHPNPIVIHASAGVTPAGCGACPPSAAGAPSCRATVSETCAEPLLTGNDDLLRRALDSLRGVVDSADGGNLVDRQLVKALRVESGEVELTLTFAPLCCSARRLAEAAFETLRRSLPDTDVYVRHGA